MKRLLKYLNPIDKLGKRQYSFLFPFITIFLVFVGIELVVHHLLRDPMAVGMFAIFIPIALIIYFAFRDGIRGGIVAAILTISYYVYIIYSRNYSGEQFRSGIETTTVLGVLFLLLAGIIGWLKQTIDKLLEREKDERRRFQSILQQLPVGVIVTDKGGKIDFANKRADIILGTKVPIGFQVGKESFVKIVESTSTNAHSLIARALSTGRSVVNEEFIIEKENGKKVYIEANASPIRNKKGNIVAVAEIVNDITAQKDLERRKDDFVNMASHELKTPITSMKLYLDALSRNLKKYDHAQVGKMIGSIQYQTERLHSLVSDLLDVSRLQTGKLTFRKEKFNLSSLVENVVIELRSVAPQRVIKFIGRGYISVNADQFRIYQVVTNLITNAIKYSDESKDIVVRVKKEEKKVVVSVQDLGIGIGKEQQKRIFDRLYQVTDSREKTFPGLGMGLYISKEIVLRHKGKIWVESVKDEGATFSFSLPTI